MAPCPATLAALHAAAFAPSRPWRAAELAELLAQPNALLVAEADGFLLARVVLDEAEVLTVAVHPAARRGGVGTRLMAAALAQAAARGARRMVLEVAADNTAARALYARAGFAQVGLRRGYYAGTDGLLLARALPECPAP